MLETSLKKNYIVDQFIIFSNNRFWIYFAKRIGSQTQLFNSDQKKLDKHFIFLISFLSISVDKTSFAK